MRRAAAVALAAALAGCSGGSAGRFDPVPPPSSWAADLAAERAAKDRQFATDPESPVRESERAAFRGLEYFDLDPSFRYAGWIERYPEPRTFTIVTTNGKPRPCARIGRLRFEVGGREQTLQVYRLLDNESRPGDEGLFLPFADATTGKETYPAGRYVDLDGPPGGPYVLDFNRAYNPWCAYGSPERFQCPVTPAENRLAIGIEAGERGYRSERP